MMAKPANFQAVEVASSRKFSLGNYVGEVFRNK